MATGKPRFTVKCIYFGRFPLRTHEQDFSTEAAHRCLHACVPSSTSSPTTTHGKDSKKKHKAKLHVHSNGLRFCPRGVFSEVDKHFYAYVNIQRFFVFKVEPKVLILGLLQNNVLYFGVLSTLTEADLNRVCDDIERAKGGGRTHVTNFHEVTNTELDLAAAQKQREQQQLLLIQEQNTRIVEMEHVRPVQAAPRRLQKVPSVHHHDGPCLKRAADGTCDEWEVADILIDYNDPDGPKVSSEGSLWLFSARQKHPYCHGVFSCESSSGDEQSEKEFHQHSFQLNGSKGEAHYEQTHEVIESSESSPPHIHYAKRSTGHHHQQVFQPEEYNFGGHHVIGKWSTTSSISGHNALNGQPTDFAAHDLAESSSRRSNSRHSSSSSDSLVSHKLENGSTFGAEEVVLETPRLELETPRLELENVAQF